MEKQNPESHEPNRREALGTFARTGFLVSTSLLFGIGANNRLNDDRFFPWTAGDSTIRRCTRALIAASIGVFLGNASTRFLDAASKDTEATPTDDDHPSRRE